MEEKKRKIEHVDKENKTGNVSNKLGEGYVEECLKLDTIES
jgi:hypothetical protein